MKFYEKLIELRKKQGLSQDELGNKINVSRQSISKWESGQANPEIEHIKELSKIFNVSVDYLLNDESENIKNKDEEIDNKKNLSKIIFRIILGIVILYLLISSYKFVVLLTYSIKANKIADYNKYTIINDSILNDKLLNETNESFEYVLCTDNIQICETYDENELETPSFISYKNSKERRAYTLRI